MEKSEFLKAFQSAMDANALIAFAANCTISYSGRAESFLAQGDRLIVIKPDKTLLVHQPSGSNPINYMKEGTQHLLSWEGSNLLLHSRNRGLKEQMRIVLLRVHFADSHLLEDREKLVLTGTEKDMAEMLYRNPELIEKGFVPLGMEEQTRYGFIDLLGYDQSHTLVVVECKRYLADFSAVEQLRRYAEKIRQSKGLDAVRGILAAPRISPNALRMLQENGFEFRKVEPPKYLETYRKDQTSVWEFEQREI